MSRDTGRAVGQALEDFGVGLNASFGPLQRGVEEERRALAARLAGLEAARERTVARRDVVSARLQVATRQFDEIDERRQARPEDFAPIRGLFFLIVAGLLIVGDVTLLGAALARLTSTFVVTGKEVPFANAVLSFAEGWWESFGPVLVLALSVLMLGTIPKVWLSTARSEPEDPRARLFRLFVFGALVASALAIVTVAGARAFLAYEESQGLQLAPLRWGLALCVFFLGVSLPYASGAFFIRGVDQVASRMSLWRSGWHRTLLHLLEWKLSAAVDRIEAERAATAERQAELQTPTYIEPRQAEIETEYRLGFTEAFHILTARHDGSLFRALRTAAVRDAIKS